MIDPNQPQPLPRASNEGRAFARGGAFSVFQFVGWVAVLGNGCVATSCQDIGAGDNLGFGLVVVVVVALLVAAGGAASIGGGALSMRLAGPSTFLRWVGTALVCLGLISTLAGARAVHSSLCHYTTVSGCR